MTEEYKEILIVKILDEPSSLSDEELESILNDTKLRDIYEVSAMVSGALTQHPITDTDNEWARFKPLIKRKPSATRWIIRIAAIFIGALLISNIASRLIDYFFPTGNQQIIAYQEPEETIDKTFFIVEPPDQSANEESAIEPTQTTVIVSDRPKLSANDETKIDEYLRIQQARIDNDLALIEAECYKDEYNAMLYIMEDLGDDNETIENTIQIVTMI